MFFEDTYCTQFCYQKPTFQQWLIYTCAETAFLGNLCAFFPQLLLNAFVRNIHLIDWKHEVAENIVFIFQNPLYGDSRDVIFINLYTQKIIS